MSLCMPLSSSPDTLVPAYDGRTCACHKQPGISHIVACCHPPATAPATFGGEPARDRPLPLHPGFAAFQAPSPQVQAHTRGLLARHAGAIAAVVRKAPRLREDTEASIRAIKSPALRAFAARAGGTHLSVCPAPDSTRCNRACSFYPHCRCEDEASCRGQ